MFQGDLFNLLCPSIHLSVNYTLSSLLYLHELLLLLCQDGGVILEELLLCGQPLGGFLQARLFILAVDLLVLIFVSLFLVDRLFGFSTLTRHC